MFMTREQMEQEIIRKLGFEHPATIWFFELIEAYNPSDEKLYGVYVALLELIAFANVIEEGAENE